MMKKLISCCPFFSGSIVVFKCSHIHHSIHCYRISCVRTGAIAKPRSFFGRGTGRILLDDVHCVGSEKTLLQCSSKPLGRNNCDHDEDVGVVCGVGKLILRNHIFSSQHFFNYLGDERRGDKAQMQSFSPPKSQLKFSDLIHQTTILYSCIC